MVVVLGHGVGQGGMDARQVGFHQAGEVRGRSGILPQQPGCQGEMHDADGCLLSAFPVGAQEGGVGGAPVGQPRVESGQFSGVAGCCATTQRPSGWLRHRWRRGAWLRGVRAGLGVSRDLIERRVWKSCYFTCAVLGPSQRYSEVPSAEVYRAVSLAHSM